MKFILIFLASLSFTLMARAEPSRSHRSALIIGVSDYDAKSGAPSLEGVPFDMKSANRIANAMGIADTHIRFIRDAEATKENILKALRQLGEKTQEGGRSFIYFSGHGTRYLDPSVNGCVEGLLSYDGKAITNAELAEASKKVTEAADKVITMLDACHSEGVAPSKASTRALGAVNFKPKFTFKAGTEANICSQPVNQKTRSLLGESTKLGAFPENVVQITSSRANEVSFDEAGKGGLATQAFRDCVLGDAKDLDGSGAISLAEIEQCTQNKINQKLLGAKDLTPHHVTISGNRNLIPVAAPQPAPVPVVAVVAPPSPAPQPAPAAAVIAAPAPAAVAAPASPPPVAQAIPAPSAAPVPSLPVPQPVKPPPTQAVAVQTAPTKPPPPPPPAPPVVPSAPPPVATPVAPRVEPALASLATLQDIHQQRNPKIKVDVRLSKTTLKIGKDPIEMSIKSSHKGYLYLVLLGSDQKSFYVLYPNGLDKENLIQAGQTKKLPRADWQLQAAGPAGTDNLLVMVSSSPRKLDKLAMAEPSGTNPFTFALNDIGGRTALVNFLVHNKDGDGSDHRFGAQLLTIKEVE